jgi:UDP-glucose 4-epimerase
MVRKITRVLVTGGAGFIGSHIVDRLLDQDFQVRILDDFSTGSLENLVHKKTGNPQLIRGDIRHPMLANKVMKDVDAVFHEAGLVSPILSVRNPKLVEDINVKGTLNLLEASTRFDVKRFIFASSAAVYGSVPHIKLKEEMAPRPTTPYGISKLAAEYYVGIFNELYGIRTISLRYFNVYGPRQRIRRNSSYASVIPIFINRLSRNLPLTVYGDGQQTRDFVYVKDVVDANVLALQCEGPKVFNIGSGKRVTINRLAAHLKELESKMDIGNSYFPPRPTDIRHGYADISRAKKTLGYTPRFSIQEGLKETLAWYRSRRIASEKHSSSVKTHLA